MKPTDSNSSQTRSSASEQVAVSESVEWAINHYQDKLRAKRFASRAIHLRTDRREKKCVAKAWKLVNLLPGVSVLDIPCGAGRMLPLLKKWGYTVTGADVSASMVEEARQYAGPNGENCLDNNDQLVVTNVFQTGFENKQFDAVMCHRLFQYFNEPQDRRMALEELHRISKGPVIVSFSCNWSLDAIGYKIRRLLGITRKRSCTPIGATTFAKDIRACGLEVERWIAMRPFISKRWYTVLKPATASCTLADVVSAYRTILWAALGRLCVVAAAILIGVFVINYATSDSDLRESQVAQILNEYQDGNNSFYVLESPHLQNMSMGKQLSVITEVARICDNITDDQNRSQDSYFLVSSEDMEKIKSTAAFPLLSFVEQVNIGNKKFTLLSTENVQYVD